MGASLPSLVLLRSLRKVGRYGYPGTSVANSRSPAPGAARWWWCVHPSLLATGYAGELVLDVMLCLLDGGQPSVEAGVLCLLLMIAHGRLMVGHVLVMVAIGREGHAPSRRATWNFFIGLLLVVVKIIMLPLPAWVLLLGALSVLRSRLLPIGMLGLVHTGRT
jgi:hypothetical protein